MDGHNGTIRQEIVTELLESKAVDFEAVGAALARFGPSLALSADDGDPFCGVGRAFFHCYEQPLVQVALPASVETRALGEAGAAIRAGGNRG